MARVADSFRVTAECHLLRHPGLGADLLAYFPLKSLVCRVNAAAAEIITDARDRSVAPESADAREILTSLEAMGVVNGVPDRTPARHHGRVPKPRRTMLLLSERCNLQCQYCYGQALTEGAVMPLEIARATADFLFANALDDPRPLVDIGFHGGGEPTTNWPVLQGVMEYAEQRGRRENVRLMSSICTNAIMSAEKARWLGEHIRNLTISIDGPPDIQNRQRPLASGGPSYDRAAATIDILDELRVRYAFRVTATELSQHRLDEVYDHLTSRFNPTAVCIEPLYVCGRCHSTRCQPPAREVFVDAIKGLTSRTFAKGPQIQYSGGRLPYLGSAFCGASGDNFFITPTGDVTSCVEVSSRDNPKAGTFIYGRYDRDREEFSFDEQKYSRLVNLRVEEFESCRDCFARWHCAGDCLAKVPNQERIKEDRNPYRCQINQEITLHQLVLQVPREDAEQPSAQEPSPVAHAERQATSS
ncbi:MAG: radical SAM protein [bacterium]